MAELTDIFGEDFEEILEKLDKLTSTDPSFKYIADAINKIPGLKSKFHAAFI